MQPDPNDAIPVIAIDGPAASGKGTVAQRVAAILGFHYLDSGALYRLVALAAERAGVPYGDEAGVAARAARLDVAFRDGDVWLGAEPVGDAIRTETMSAAASRVAALPAVRQVLLARQRAFRAPPGLVADGRDMGTIVFPRARLKIYLTASVQARAQRRYKQLMEKGLGANIQTLLRDIRERDARDSARAAAPLEPAEDAIEIDTTALSIEHVVDRVLALWQKQLEAQ
ncbi:MAG: (d)CMP kinase [Betaproteobacteria bacterium]|nr:(d)CMP kinase [Betaproteobacteria bacterium]